MRMYHDALYGIPGLEDRQEDRENMIDNDTEKFNIEHVKHR